MNYEQILIGTFVLINLVSFVVMAYDKRKSIRGSGMDRTPEGQIFCMAALFGSIGVYAAMLLFRHKTKKWYFQIGIPLLILQNLVAIYTLMMFLPID